MPTNPSHVVNGFPLADRRELLDELLVYDGRRNPADELRELKKQYGSIRRRGDQVYRLQSWGRSRSALDAQLVELDGFITWEPFALKVPSAEPPGSYRTISNCFALWLAVARVEQPQRIRKPQSTDVLTSAAAPMARGLAHPYRIEPPALPPFAGGFDELLRDTRETLERIVQPQSTDVLTSARRPRSAKTTRHKGITRIDTPSMHGYRAFVAWERAKFSRWFSDRKHGDRLGALDAALEWRDKTERELGKPRTEGRVVGISTKDDLPVGVIAVRNRSGVLIAYQARWGLGRRGQTKNYNVAEHGARRALQKAKKARREGLRAYLAERELERVAQNTKTRMF